MVRLISGPSSTTSQTSEEIMTEPITVPSDHETLEERTLLAQKNIEIDALNARIAELERIAAAVADAATITDNGEPTE